MDKALKIKVNNYIDKNAHALAKEGIAGTSITESGAQFTRNNIYLTTAYHLADRMDLNQYERQEYSRKKEEDMDPENLKLGPEHLKHIIYLFELAEQRTLI